MWKLDIFNFLTNQRINYLNLYLFLKVIYLILIYNYWIFDKIMFFSKIDRLIKLNIKVNNITHNFMSLIYL